MKVRYSWPVRFILARQFVGTAVAFARNAWPFVLVVGFFLVGQIL